MSHEERYGTLVWNALVEAFNSPFTLDEAWITVGEVANIARITKPTAAKYLNRLIAMNNAKRVCVGKGKAMVYGYRPQWGEK